MFGDKPISKLKDGEILVTYNEKLKKNEFKRINKVYKYVNVDEILYTLIFDNQEARNTPEAGRVSNSQLRRVVACLRNLIGT